MLTTIIVTVILGAIIGALARLVLPGRQNISHLGDRDPRHPRRPHRQLALHGSPGKSDTGGIDWIALIIGVIVAAVAILVYGMITGRSQSGSTHHPHDLGVGLTPFRPPSAPHRAGGGRSCVQAERLEPDQALGPAAPSASGGCR